MGEVTDFLFVLETGSESPTMACGCWTYLDAVSEYSVSLGKQLLKGDQYLTN